MKKSPLVLLPLMLTSLLGVQAQEPTVTRLPETSVTGFESVLSESTPIGSTRRPEWTSARRFTNTRVYIQQEPWEVGVESWWRIKHHRDGTVSNRLLEEVEIGLPYRMQLDLYTDIEGDNNARFHYQSFNVELRWALADWGQIWGNPTFYGEYKFADSHWAPDVYEFKVLFGDEFAKRWHWGVNFVWEAEVGGEREQEFQVTGGLSYTVIDSKFGVGVEFLYDRSTVASGRGDDSNSLNIGPSLQFRPTERLHVDLTCMFGTNADADKQVGYIVVGYELGSAKGKSGRTYTPVAGQHN